MKLIPAKIRCGKSACFALKKPLGDRDLPPWEGAGGAALPRQVGVGSKEY